MGLLMDLPKECNSLHHDFNQAYWSIEDISFASQGSDGSVMVAFMFHAYPDREAKRKTLLFEEALPFRTFGGPITQTVNARLYRWAGLFTASLIFPNGIPTTRNGQMAAMYPYVKSYLNLGDATDVLEDE